VYVLSRVGAGVRVTIGDLVVIPDMQFLLADSG
jgi:hypothetical protein